MSTSESKLKACETKKHILIIDDNDAVRKAFTLALEETPYEVDGAASGEKGLEMYQEKGYDLIYLDLKMPGLNGTDTLRELRKHSSDVPVYIVTAFHKEFFQELQILEAEGIAFDLLKKPVESDQILMVTQSVFEGPTVQDAGH